MSCSCAPRKKSMESHKGEMDCSDGEGIHNDAVSAGADNREDDANKEKKGAELETNNIEELSTEIVTGEETMNIEELSTEIASGEETIMCATTIRSKMMRREIWC